MSETAPGGRRRKLGSNRKSQGHQINKNQTARGERITDTQNGSNVNSIIDESVIETTEEESLGLDKIVKVSSKLADFYVVSFSFLFLQSNNFWWEVQL